MRQTCRSLIDKSLQAGRNTWHCERIPGLEIAPNDEDVPPQTSKSLGTSSIFQSLTGESLVSRHKLLTKVASGT